MTFEIPLLFIFLFVPLRLCVFVLNPFKISPTHHFQVLKSFFFNTKTQRHEDTKKHSIGLDVIFEKFSLYLIYFKSYPHIIIRD